MDYTLDFPGAEFCADALLLYQHFRRRVGGERYLFAQKHFLQFSQLLFHNLLRHFFIHAVEHHNSVQAVAEFRLKDAFHFFQKDFGADILTLEADAVFSHSACTGIGRHNDDNITEIRFSSLVVGEGGVIHGLQQDIVDIRVGFLDFVQQKDGMGRFTDFLREQSAFLVTHISGGGADELGHGVLFLVFAHVKADEPDAQLFRKASGNFRFSDTGGSYEQQACQGLSLFQKPCPCEFYGVDYLGYGFILSENAAQKPALQGAEALCLVIFHYLFGNLAGFGQDFVYEGFVHGLAFPFRVLHPGAAFLCRRLVFLRRRVHTAVGAGLVYQVDCLVRQVTLVDIFGAHLHGIFQHAFLIGNAVEGLIGFTQALQNSDSIPYAGFLDIYILEPSYQALVL